MKISNTTFYPTKIHHQKRKAHTKPQLFKANDAFESCNFPFSFKGEIRLKDIEELNCAYCGRPMITNKDYHDMANMNGEELSLKMEEYLHQNRNLYNDGHQSAIRYVQKLARQNPDATAEELLYITNAKVRKTIIKKQIQYNTLMKQNIREIGCKELREYVGSLNLILQDIKNLSDGETDKYFENEKNKRFILKKIKKLQTRYAPNHYSKNFSAWDKFIRAFVNFYNPKLEKYEIELLRVLQTATTANDKEYAYHFVRMLFNNSATSEEHIKPYSQAGTSNSSNYLATHSICNSKRGTTPFWDFIKNQPPIQKNIISYFANFKRTGQDYTAEDAQEYIDKAISSIKCEVNNSNSYFAQEFLSELEKSSSSSLIPESIFPNLNKEKHSYFSSSMKMAAYYAIRDRIGIDVKNRATEEIISSLSSEEYQAIQEELAVIYQEKSSKIINSLKQKYQNSLNICVRLGLKDLYEKIQKHQTQNPLLKLEKGKKFPDVAFDYERKQQEKEEIEEFLISNYPLKMLNLHKKEIKDMLSVFSFTTNIKYYLMLDILSKALIEETGEFDLNIVFDELKNLNKKTA